jgi:hypothetical protein
MNQAQINGFLLDRELEYVNQLVKEAPDFKVVSFEDQLKCIDLADNIVEKAKAKAQKDLKQLLKEEKTLKKNPDKYMIKKDGRSIKF